MKSPSTLEIIFAGRKQILSPGIETGHAKFVNSFIPAILVKKMTATFCRTKIEFILDLGDFRLAIFKRGNR